MPVTLNGTNGLTFNDGTSQRTAASGFGFKNRIINGDMRIDQRNNGAAVTVNSASGSTFYAVDRFFGQGQAADGVFTMQRSTTAPAGYSNSLLVTVTTADAALGASQAYQIVQPIEGFNVADLAWGSASAATVTLSFVVRSSVTGTFGGAVFNAGANRSYPFTYTINSANTFEQKSITIPGDTTGTWGTGNGVGMYVIFGLGVGSTLSGTAGAWAGAQYNSATGATNLMATLNATFYITGVQLEKGSTATSFDYRPYGTELALCQRYYYRRNYPITNEIVAVFQAYGAGAGFGKILDFPVAMRTAPTAAVSSTSHFGPSNTTGNNQAVFTATTIDLVNVLGLGTGGWAGSSGLAAGNATVINARSTSAYIEASAEL